jgi:CubicO group peptidase (beta-lactamase class C family)
MAAARLSGVAMLLTATALWASAPGTAQPGSLQAHADKLFARWTASTPGCAVGADVKGQAVLRGAYGMADLERDVPITPDTIFEAGSVSKQFTAAAILLLARDGKLSLDDRVRRHIPELPDSAAAITIRQMLQHTAGLRDWGSLAAIAGWPRGSRVHTHAHVLEIISRQRALNFAPGTHFSYSNSGYNLAVILASRVSGMPFPEFTKTRLFEPLGMRDTSWRDDHTRIVKRRAVAYGERQGGFEINMPFENVYGNGGLLTTVGDLLKWNANFASPIVGDASFVAELERRATFNDGRSYEYALGLYVDTYRGVREVDHSGGTAGYRAHLARYPDQQVSVAVLCNAAGANATSYAKSIAEQLLTGLATPTDPTASYSLSAEEGARLAGLYRSTDPIGLARVVYDKNGLAVPNVHRLAATSPTRFVTGDSYTYEFGAGGEMRTTDEFGTVIRYDRVVPAPADARPSQELEGQYVSDDIETTLTVSIEGNTVVVRRRPDLVAPLTPVYADAFASSLGWVVFRRDSSHRVVGLSVSQGRVWDLPFTRQAAAGTRAQ